MLEKVAIFLDVENLAHWLKLDGGETLLERSSELGRVVVRRAYGDFSLPSVSKRQSELNLLGFEFVHVYHPVKGKNSADIQIVVDVMEYLSRVPDLQWFVLATGDADFSPLFRRLRELGKSVVGIGPTSKLSEVVKKSCNRFIYTDINTNYSKSNKEKKEIRESYLELIEKILNRTPEEITLSMLKTSILEIDPSFDERLAGYSKFLSFLKSAPDLIELRLDKKQTTWFAKSVEDEHNNRKQSMNLAKGSPPIKPTSEGYKRLLKKSGMRWCPDHLLWDIINSLESAFSQPFTQSESLEFLIDKFDQSYSRGEIRTSTFILYKAGYIIKHQEVKNTHPTLSVNLPSSKEDMQKNIDLILISRIYSQCHKKGIEFMPDLVLPLLFNQYQSSEINKIVSTIEIEKIE